MTVRAMDRNDAMIESLWIQWITDFLIIDNPLPNGEGKVMDFFSLDLPVRFYDYKQLSTEGDRAKLERPNVIMQQLSLPDGDVPAVAGSGMPRIARCGVLIAVETPIAYTDAAGTSDLGGRDNLLQPISAAIQNWFDDNSSVQVPDAIRYVDADPAKAIIFPPHVLDVRKANPFIIPGRRLEFERITFNVTLEALETS